HKIPKDKKLDFIPSRDFYGPVLTHGPLFHVLGGVLSVDENKIYVRSQSKSSAIDCSEGFLDRKGALVLGDPYNRDGLMQTLLIMSMRYNVIPVSIGKLEFFGNKPFADGERINYGIGSLDDDKFVLGDVESIVSGGKVVERMTGFKGKVMRIDKSRLSIEEIVYPADRDPKAFLDKTCGFIKTIKDNDIGYNMAYVPELRVMKDEMCYELFQNLIEESFPRMEGASRLKGKKAIVTVDENKKLSVMIGDEKWNFDYCHTDYHAIVFVAKHRLSCSIARVYDRSNEQEVKDVVSRHQNTYEVLSRYGESEELTSARLVAIENALLKLDYKKQTEFTLEEYGENNISFKLPGEHKARIKTYDVTLARGGRYVVSLVTTDEKSTEISPDLPFSA
ncbi:MAG: polyketide synthase dehydratase domain-containing protein, partial [Oligoflexales bacterium]|nr:polyketide synthase dehydratase domain-containing protein [Oligoflexales bacterium]